MDEDGRLKGDIRKFQGSNSNEIAAYQKEGDKMKTVLRGKFIDIKAHIKKNQRSQIK
jgi:hypothetical protein